MNVVITAVIVVEKLQLHNMTRSDAGTIGEPSTKVAAKAGLNCAILDVGIDKFITYLRYKAVKAGSTVIAVKAFGHQPDLQRLSRIGAQAAQPTSARLCLRP